MTTRKVPDSIDSTGNEDVSAKLNSWMKSEVHMGDTAVFPPTGKYLCESTLVFDRKKHIRVEGQGALIFAKTNGEGGKPSPLLWFQTNPGSWPLNRQHIDLWQCLDVTINGLRIRGSNRDGGPGSYNPKYEGQAGISIDDSDDTIINDCVINNTFGDGVEINRGCNHTVVNETEIAFNGRQGMTFLNSHNTRLWHNVLHHIGRTAFDGEPERGGMLDGVEVIENTVIGPIGGIFFAATGAGHTSDNILLQGNKLYGVPLIVRNYNETTKEQRKNMKVLDNMTTYGYDNYPIGMMTFGWLDGLTVKRNRASAKPEEAVKYGKDVINVLIEGNSWQG